MRTRGTASIISSDALDDQVHGEDPRESDCHRSPFLEMIQCQASSGQICIHLTCRSPARQTILSMAHEGRWGEGPPFRGERDYPGPTAVISTLLPPTISSRTVRWVNHVLHGKKKTVDLMMKSHHRGSSDSSLYNKPTAVVRHRIALDLSDGLGFMQVLAED
jgi:hypothetical protein